MRRRAGADSWGVIQRFVLMLIKAPLGEIKNERDSAFLIIKVQFYAIRKIFGRLEIFTRYVECKKEKANSISPLII